MKSKNKGSALVDYAVPTLIVGVIAGVALFNIVNGGSLLKFFAASLNINAVDGTGTASIASYNSSDTAEMSTPGGLGGTSENPVVQCSFGYCNIDFGDYVLSGIPDNFSDYVKSTSSSGGTELLANLLMAIANSPNIDTSTSKIIKDLANKGHSMASNERTIEFEVEYVSQADGTCLTDDFDTAKFALTNESDEFMALLEQVNSLLSGSSNPGSEEAMAIINILGDEILSLANQITFNAGGIGAGYSLDPDITAGTTIEQSLFESILAGPSEVTDINSAIICTTGNGEDSGHNCG